MREDDKPFQDNMRMWHIQQNKLSKQQDGLFDLDYVPSLWMGQNKNMATYNQVDSDARGLPVVGFGRKNPNVSRQTGNRKNKNKNK